MISERIPEGKEPVLELGSGGGFLHDSLGDLITSDVVESEDLQLVANAQALPLRGSSLRAIVMVNTFHHVPDVRLFLDEAQRSIRPGGRLVMIEPWNTSWSRFLHRHLHDEHMDPESDEWAFPSSGPMSGANAALAWIVAERDRVQMEREWPLLSVIEASPFMPLSYLLSGGVSLRSLQPRWMYRWWRWFEEHLPFLAQQALFAVIVIERTGTERGADDGSLPPGTPRVGGKRKP